MSAYCRPGLTIKMVPPPRQRAQSQADRWRKAMRRAAPSIGDSAWDWTELKEPARPRTDEVAPLRRPRAAGSRGGVRPIAAPPPWQA